MGNPAVIRTASASGGAGPASAPATGNDAAPAQRTDFLATLAAALGGDAQEAVELIERRAGEDEPVPAEEGDGEDAAALLAGLLQLIAPAHRPCTADKLPGTGNSLEMMHGAPASSWPARRRSCRAASRPRRTSLAVRPRRTPALT